MTLIIQQCCRFEKKNGLFCFLIFLKGGICINITEKDSKVVLFIYLIYVYNIQQERLKDYKQLYNSLP